MSDLRAQLKEALEVWDKQIAVIDAQKEVIASQRRLIEMHKEIAIEGAGNCLNDPCTHPFCPEHSDEELPWPAEIPEEDQ